MTFSSLTTGPSDKSVTRRGALIDQGQCQLGFCAKLMGANVDSARQMDRITNFFRKDGRSCVDVVYGARTFTARKSECVFSLMRIIRR